MNFEQIYSKYANMVFKICMIHLQNEHDASDVVQDTFLKFLEKQDSIKDSEHIKAWLIRVSINKCNDLYRKRKNSLNISMEELEKIVNDDKINLFCSRSKLIIFIIKIFINISFGISCI